MKIKVDNGRYEFVLSDEWTLDVLRYGKPWVKRLDAVNAIRGLMDELDAARVVLQAVGEILDAPEASGVDIRIALQGAMARHAGLVCDQEAPSDWARIEVQS